MTQTPHTSFNQQEVHFFLLDLVSGADYDQINAKLPATLKLIKTILLEIKAAQDPRDINTYFDLLQEIHYALDIVYYRKGLEFNAELAKFSSDGDRLDDPWTRDFLFNLIKHDKYHLETGVSLFQEGFDEQ